MSKKDKLKVACVISGGKDGIFAYSELKRRSDYDIKILLNLYVGEDEVSFHQYEKRLVALQAEAIGLPLIQKKIVRQYEDQKLFDHQLKKIILDLKRSGIEGISFGYILAGDYQDMLLHRICEEVGIELILPNYKKNSSSVLVGIVESGIKSIITSVNPEKLSDEWLGCQIDRRFIQKIKNMKGIDPCGDAGEYHSFVLDAPFFSKSLEKKSRAKKVFETSTTLDGEVFRHRNLSLSGLVLTDKRLKPKRTYRTKH